LFIGGLYFGMHASVVCIFPQLFVAKYSEILGH